MKFEDFLVYTSSSPSSYFMHRTQEEETVYITCLDTFLAVILGRKFLGLYHQEVT
jgi:hypothetical protein